MDKKDKWEMTEDPFYDLSHVASTHECTGLVPSAVEDQEESEAYGELYAIHPPKSQKNMIEDALTDHPDH